MSCSNTSNTKCNFSYHIQTPKDTNFDVAGYRLKHGVECFDIAAQLKSNS